MTKKLVVFVSLLVSSLCWAQANHCTQTGINHIMMCTNYVVNGDPNFNTTAPFTFADNTSNAKSIDVWHQIVGAPSNLVQSTSGYDVNGVLRHYFLDSSGSIWEYIDPWNPTNPNTWVHHTEMGTGAVKIVASNFIGYTGLFAEFLNAGCPHTSRGQQYIVYRFQNNTWGNSGLGCAYDFDISDDGEAILLYDTANGIGLEYSSGNGQWDGAWASVGWSHIAIQNSGQAFGVSVPPYLGIYELNLVAKSDKLLTGVTITSTAPISSDSAGLVWTVDSSGYVNEYNGTSWSKYLGTGFTAVDSCGTFCTFGISGGAPYRFPEKSMTASPTLAGNTTCTDQNGQPITCPAHHDGTLEAKFVSHSLNGGQTVDTGMTTTETQYNLKASDTTYDPFDCIEAGFDSSSCLTSTGPVPPASVACTVAGTIIGTIVAPSFCDIPTNYWNHWSYFATVTIYFDQSAFSGPVGKSYALDFFSGMSSWIGFRGVTYTFGGQVPIGGSCGSTTTTWGRVVGLPCNPAYPYVVVTASAPGDDVSYSEPVQVVSKGSTHQFSVTTFGQYLFSSTPNHRTSRGAHEEGHRRRLGDCGLKPGDCGSLTASGTVMWENNDPNLPTLPTFCDQLWAGIDDEF